MCVCVCVCVCVSVNVCRVNESMCVFTHRLSVHVHVKSVCVSTCTDCACVNTCAEYDLCACISAFVMSVFVHIVRVCT